MPGMTDINDECPNCFEPLGGRVYLKRDAGGLLIAWHWNCRPEETKEESLEARVEALEVKVAQILAQEAEHPAMRIGDWSKVESICTRCGRLTLQGEMFQTETGWTCEPCIKGKKR